MMLPADAIEKIKNEGLVSFDTSQYTRGISLTPFMQLKQDFPSGVFTRSVDDVEYALTEDDKEQIEILRNKLLHELEKIDPDIILEWHFLGYGVNPDITPWHNDYGSKFPGHNATVNVFFDDCDLDGMFSIYQNGQQFINTIPIQKHQAIIFNQNKEWVHAVAPTKKLRRVISFAAMFPTLM